MGEGREAREEESSSISDGEHAVKKEANPPARSIKRWASKKVIVRAVIALTLILIVAILYVHDVSEEPTSEDIEYTNRLLNQHKIEPPRDKNDFGEQVDFIVAVQNMLIKHAPQGEPIPQSQPREVKDIFEAQHGQCFDRSRALEKILAVHGIESRHVSIFEHSNSRWRLSTILGSGVPSHAFTEVRTAEGWLVVDSVVPWVSLDSEGTPVSLSSLQGRYEDIDWRNPEVEPPKIMRGEFVRVYGLYSRHGKFYPPYNAIPDISWGTFLDNFW